MIDIKRFIKFWGNLKHGMLRSEHTLHRGEGWKKIEYPVNACGSILRDVHLHGLPATRVLWTFWKPVAKSLALSSLICSVAVCDTAQR